MKIDIYKDESSVAHNVESDSMRIDTSKQAKLFHMLSSTLYSNKVAAVIRELASNGYDSHKAAGKLDTPIDFYAPTLETLEFKIRDYGTGLTGSEARDTILCYLGSSKDNTDDFIGGWGIGSKSPFAYAKNYTVVCYKDGIRYEFFCWKDDHGLPTTSLVGESATDEPNGVEISVPVDSYEVGKFRRAILDYLLWTNYNIRLIGDKRVERDFLCRIEMSGATLEVFRPDRQYLSDTPMKIVYGGYSYAFNDVVADEVSSHLYVKLRSMVRSGYNIAIICNDPGAITFNMNREEIEITEKSKAWVRNILNELYTEVSKHSDAHQEISNASLSNLQGNEKLLRLKEFQTILDGLMKIGEDDISKFVAVAFKTLKDTYRYNWNSSIQKPVRGKSKPQLLFSSEFSAGKLTEQIRVFWYRRAAFANYGIHDEYDPLFPASICIKADSEEGARKKLTELSDFEEFDISEIPFYEIETRAAPPRKPSASSGNASPRVRCATRKGIIPWSHRTLYLMASEEQVTKYGQMVVPLKEQFDHFITGTNAKFNKFVIFTPSDTLIKNHASKPQFMWLNEFLHDSNEIIARYREEYSIPGPGALEKLGRLARRLERSTWGGNVTDFVSERLRQGIDELNEFIETARSLRSMVVFRSTKRCKNYATILRRGSSLLHEATECGKNLEYISTRSLGSDIRRGNKQAVEFAERLDIMKYFKEV